MQLTWRQLGKHLIVHFRFLPCFVVKAAVMFTFMPGSTQQDKKLFLQELISVLFPSIERILGSWFAQRVVNSLWNFPYFLSDVMFFEVESLGCLGNPHDSIITQMAAMQIWHEYRAIVFSCVITWLQLVSEWKYNGFSYLLRKTKKMKTPSSIFGYYKGISVLHTRVKHGAILHFARPELAIKLLGCVNL